MSKDNPSNIQSSVVDELIKTRITLSYFLKISITFLCLIFIFNSIFHSAGHITINYFGGSDNRRDSPGDLATKHAPYHKNLHPVGHQIINITNFTVPLNRDICNISDIGIVTIVHTAVTNQYARKIIRDSWGNPKLPGVNTRLVFLLGLTSDMKAQKDLEKESEMYGDIVQGGFVDAYHNLSYKNIFGNFWVSTFCEQAEIVVKSDDDMYVDLYAVWTMSRKWKGLANYRENKFIMCPILWKKEVVRRDPSNKWFVSEDDLPSSRVPGGVYPLFCLGWVYILTPGTAAKLVEKAKTTPFLWLDDVWVTGFISREAGITPKYVKGYVRSNSMKRVIVMKSIQRQAMFHEDFFFARQKRTYWFTMVLEMLARENYNMKSSNGLYSDRETGYGAKVLDKVMSRFIKSPKKSPSQKEYQQMDLWLQNMVKN